MEECGVKGNMARCRRGRVGGMQKWGLCKGEVGRKGWISKRGAKFLLANSAHTKGGPN